MPGQATARIRGLPDFPSVTEVNVRSNASTAQQPLFKVPVGMSGQLIREVQPDLEGKNLNGKIYQWFKLSFDGGAVGWVRDDLLEVQGDLTAFGYPDLSALTFAFSLTRGAAAPATPAPPAPAPAAPAPVAPAPVTVPAHVPPGATTVPIQASVLASGTFPDANADTDRVQKASYRIAATFEGGYGAYNNYDAGIVSYGFLQFTLAAGSLATVVRNFTDASQSAVANTLRGYLPRVVAKDALLRNDTGFRDALRAATSEPQMIDAQHSVAASFWKSVVDGYIAARGLKYPLTWALLFDMGVNFGVNHGFVRLAEQDLGVVPRSRPGENGITEEQLMTYVAQLRKRSHDRQAERDNLPGLRRRGDFWMEMVSKGDWYLRGDETGNVFPKGRPVNVLNP